MPCSTCMSAPKLAFDQALSAIFARLEKLDVLGHSAQGISVGDKKLTRDLNTSNRNLADNSTASPLAIGSVLPQGQMSTGEFITALRNLYAERAAQAETGLLKEAELTVERIIRYHAIGELR